MSKRLPFLIALAFASPGCIASGHIDDGSLGGAVPGDPIGDGTDGGAGTDAALDDSAHPTADAPATPSDSGAKSPTDAAKPPTDTGGPLPGDTGTPPPSDSGSGPTLPTCGPYVAPTAGACGTERWSVKIGSDPAACTTPLDPKTTTIAELSAVPHPGTLPSNARVAPTETTVWELHDVTLSQYKLETDLDYHLVLADAAGATLIAEIPSPTCVPGNGAWHPMIKAARAAFDAKHSVSTGWSYGPETVSLRGMGFFDVPHSQTGLAPNAVELHAVFAICFGAGCKL